jgi:hypothetical protein
VRDCECWVVDRRVVRDVKSGRDRAVAIRVGEDAFVVAAVVRGAFATRVGLDPEVSAIAAAAIIAPPVAQTETLIPSLWPAPLCGSKVSEWTP